MSVEAGTAIENKLINPNWEDFKKALAVFKGDYAIVNHEGTPFRLPWEEPNQPGKYTVVQISEDVTEEAFIAEMREVQDIVVTCMDKDCAHSTWSKVSQNGSKKVGMLTWGGGVVQHDIQGREGAVEAIEVIARYLAKLKRNGDLPGLITVHTDDHDSVCGAVKAFLGDTALHEYLTKITGREITAHSPEEDEVMAALIRHGSQVFVNAFLGTGVKVVAELHDTHRDNPENSNLTMIPLGTEYPEMDIASLLMLLKLTTSKKS